MINCEDSLLGRTADAAVEAASATTLAKEKEENIIRTKRNKQRERLCTLKMYKTKDVKKESHATDAKD